VAYLVGWCSSRGFFVPVKKRLVQKIILYFRNPSAWKRIFVIFGNILFLIIRNITPVFIVGPFFFCEPGGGRAGNGHPHVSYSRGPAEIRKLYWSIVGKVTKLSAVLVRKVWFLWVNFLAPPSLLEIMVFVCFHLGGGVVWREPWIQLFFQTWKKKLILFLRLQT